MKWLRFVGLLLFMVTMGYGEDLYVGGTHEFESITQAIAEAADGDVIWVSAGTYEESISFEGKAITICGLDGAAVLQGAGESEGICFAGSETQDSIVQNMVITGWDVGIQVSNASPTIQYVTVVANDIGIDASVGGTPLISNSIIWGNETADLSECTAEGSWVEQEINTDIMSELAWHWGMDEVRGKGVYDAVSGYHGSIIGPEHDTGVVGNGLWFDGEDDYVRLPDNEPVWLPTEDFTLSLWIYPEREPGTHENFLCLNFGASSNPDNELGAVLQRLISGNLIFGFTTAGNSDEILSVPDCLLGTHQWYHLVAVREGTFQGLYVDGQLVGTRACSAGPVIYEGGYDDDRVSLGMSTYSAAPRPRNHFKGGMDELMIFNRGLDENEVLQLYAYGLLEQKLDTGPLFAAPLEGDYRLLSQAGRYWPDQEVWVADGISSPCVDAGDLLEEGLEEPVPNGGYANLGAYGLTSQASLGVGPTHPDVNRDGVVDMDDWEYWNWLWFWMIDN